MEQRQQISDSQGMVPRGAGVLKYRGHEVLTTAIAYYHALPLGIVEPVKYCGDIPNDSWDLIWAAQYQAGVFYEVDAYDPSVLCVVSTLDQLRGWLENVDEVEG